MCMCINVAQYLACPVPHTQFVFRKRDLQIHRQTKNPWSILSPERDSPSYFGENGGESDAFSNSVFIVLFCLVVATTKVLTKGWSSRAHALIIVFASSIAELLLQRLQLV